MVDPLIFYILSYCLHFFKFSTPSENVEFHVHRSHMKIGLSQVIKFCATNLIKKTHLLFPYQMITKCGDNVSTIKCELLEEMSHRIKKKRFKDPLQFYDYPSNQVKFKNQ